MENKTKTTKINKGKNVITGNPISKGLIFLINAVISQWKVLLTITLIFMLIITGLSIITYGIDQVTDGYNFVVSGPESKLTFGDAFWWVYVTISTIGYGDIYPISGWMRFWAIIISLIGMSFIALYTAVVVNGFAKELQKSRDNAFNDLQEQDEKQDNEIERLKNENKKLRKQVSELNKK